MSGLFITSSGTGLGKTFVTCALLAHDRQHHQIFSASKLIISGWPEDEAAQAKTDTACLLSAQGKPCVEPYLSQMSPFRFQAPLSPDLAAKLTNFEVAPQDLLQHAQTARELAEAKGQCHLFEGVGGVMCPIAPQFTVLDWIEAVQCPAVLVVGSYLGALSHTLTALAVLKNRGISIAALIVNETLDSTVPLPLFLESLRANAPDHKVFILPHQSNDTNELSCDTVIASLYTHLFDMFNVKKCA